VVSVVVLAILVPLGLVAWRDEGTTAAWDGSGPMPSWGDGGFATSDEGDPLFAWEDGYREPTAPPSDGARRGADVIGDRRTADPCALLRPAALGRFGPAELDPDLGNFDRCQALVRPPGGPVVDVEVGFDLEPPPEQAPPARVTGDVAVVEGPAQSHACTRTLTVAGVIGTTITITAGRDSTGTAPLCEIADAATGDAANTLNQGVIARRPAPPSHSLAHRDACTLLDARALEVVPGVDAAAADRGFGGWGCDWASTTGDVRVGLRFHRGPPPDAAGGASTQVNGLRAFVRPGGDGDETCLVEVPYRSYAGRTGQTAAESLRLVASGSPAEEELCRMAADLAGSAAARLPRP
ncbi:hypothetical protein, partial [Nonomuraea terrae]|uniref:hypothetical protein n=1 Tax=Nonomuraea terrae TaxID=2530383 RepID=UPI001CB6DC94